jgi:hypothetical protein
MRASWRSGRSDDEMETTVDIGEPQRKIVVEPIRDPVPERTPKPLEVPATPNTPEPVPSQAH